jgi:hypothetical protein
MVEFAHSLPYGRHKNEPLTKVSTTYLLWAVSELKLSVGLSAAIRTELRSRGVTVSEPPPPPRKCSRCDYAGEPKATWLHQRDGRRAIRGECARCGTWLGALPLTPENRWLADQSTDPSALLTLLIRLEESGIDIRLDGDRVVFDPLHKVTAELQHLERQCRGQLVAMLAAPDRESGHDQPDRPTR